MASRRRLGRTSGTVAESISGLLNTPRGIRPRAEKKTTPDTRTLHSQRAAYKISMAVTTIWFRQYCTTIDQLLKRWFNAVFGWFVFNMRVIKNPESVLTASKTNSSFMLILFVVAAHRSQMHCSSPLLSFLAGAFRPWIHTGAGYLMHSDNGCCFYPSAIKCLVFRPTHPMPRGHCYSLC